MATKILEGKAKMPHDVQHQEASSGFEPPNYTAQGQENAWAEAKQDAIDMQRLGKKQEFKVYMIH